MKITRLNKAFFVRKKPVDDFLILEKQIVTPDEMQAETEASCTKLALEWQYISFVMSNAPVINSSIKAPGDYVIVNKKDCSFAAWDRFLNLLRSKGYDVLEGDEFPRWRLGFAPTETFRSSEAVIGWKLPKKQKQE